MSRNSFSHADLQALAKYRSYHPHLIPSIAAVWRQLAAAHPNHTEQSWLSAYKVRASQIDGSVIKVHDSMRLVLVGALTQKRSSAIRSDRFYDLLAQEHPEHKANAWKSFHRHYLPNIAKLVNSAIARLPPPSSPPAAAPAAAASTSRSPAVPPKGVAAAPRPLPPKPAPALAQSTQKKQEKAVPTSSSSAAASKRSVEPPSVPKPKKSLPITTILPTPPTASTSKLPPPSSSFATKAIASSSSTAYPYRKPPPPLPSQISDAPIKRPSYPPGSIRPTPSNTRRQSFVPTPKPHTSPKQPSSSSPARAKPNFHVSVPSSPRRKSTASTSSSPKTGTIARKSLKEEEVEDVVEIESDKGSEGSKRGSSASVFSALDEEFTREEERAMCRRLAEGELRHWSREKVWQRLEKEITNHSARSWEKLYWSDVVRFNKWTSKIVIHSAEHNKKKKKERVERSSEKIEEEVVEQAFTNVKPQQKSKGKQVEVSIKLEDEQAHPRSLPKSTRPREMAPPPSSGAPPRSPIKQTLLSSPVKSQHIVPSPPSSGPRRQPAPPPSSSTRRHPPPPTPSESPPHWNASQQLIASLSKSRSPSPGFELDQQVEEDFSPQLGAGDEEEDLEIIPESANDDDDDEDDDGEDRVRKTEVEEEEEESEDETELDEEDQRMERMLLGSPMPEALDEDEEIKDYVKEEEVDDWPSCVDLLNEDDLDVDGAWGGFKSEEQMMVDSLWDTIKSLTDIEDRGSEGVIGVGQSENGQSEEQEEEEDAVMEELEAIQKEEEEEEELLRLEAEEEAKDSQEVEEALLFDPIASPSYVSPPRIPRASLAVTTGRFSPKLSSPIVQNHQPLPLDLAESTSAFSKPTSSKKRSSDSGATADTFYDRPTPPKKQKSSSVALNPIDPPKTSSKPPQQPISIPAPTQEQLDEFRTSCKLRARKYSLHLQDVYALSFYSGMPTSSDLDAALEVWNDWKTGGQSSESEVEVRKIFWTKEEDLGIIVGLKKMVEKCWEERGKSEVSARKRFLRGIDCVRKEKYLKKGYRDPFEIKLKVKK